MRLMSERGRAVTEQQIFRCLMCHKCLAGSFTEMNEETAVQPTPIHSKIQRAIALHHSTRLTLN